MKRLLLFFLCVIFTSINAYSQIQYGLCDAVITETGTGKNITFTDPYTNHSRSVFAGTMVGTVEGNPTRFYCIDIKRTLSFPDSCHKDSAVANPKIVYILNNYYPYNPNPVGELSNTNEEAAATQLAIWHFSDGVNLNTITDNSVKARALQIKADADANGTNTDVFTTISIDPGNDPNGFFIRTTDQNNSGIAVNNITLTISQGTLSVYTVNTDGTGNSPEVIVSGTNSGLITAIANVIVPQGITFTCPPGKQRLVLAKPTIGERSVTRDFGALPVELTSFVSAVAGNNITLSWSTGTELNNAGFNVERKSSVSGEWIVIGHVTGNGTSNAPHSYSYTNKNVQPGKYNYRLKQIDFNGNFEYFNLSNEIEVGAPSKFDLKQNFPNPFNPTTKISYEIPNSGFVTIKVFDNLGREVSTLVNEFKSAGYYTLDFSGENLTSGLYFYRLEANGFSKVMKMTLVK